MTIEEHVCKLYRDGKSTYEIASLLGDKWYSNKVMRLLKKCGIKLRDKAESQTIALSSGRANHPTRGKKHSAKTRSVIGKGVSRAWENMTDEERARRSDISKANWDLMTENERDELRALAAKAVRKAAVEGSKIEKFILIKLRNAGWDVEFHTERRLPSQTLQIDLFVKNILTAIELDGATHWEAVWGEEHLQKTIASDNKKNSLLIQNGYNVIRIRTRISKVSQVYMDKVWLILEQELSKLKDNYRRNVEDRLIILDI